MAVSGLEQRHVPLLLTCPVWSPWGPGRTSPFEDESEEQSARHSELQKHEDERTERVYQRKRSLSWGGYSPHSLATQCAFGTISDVSTEEPKDDSSEEAEETEETITEPVTPTTPKSPGRAKSGRQRRKPSSSHECSLSCPVLLGNTTTKGTELKMPEGRLEKSSNSIENSANGKSQRKSKSFAPESHEVTTLMVRNLPYNLTQQGLVETLDSSGFKGLFDFCYLPHKFNEHTNLGFAFLNFVNPEVARKFTNEWHQSRIFMTSGMRKSLNVTAAVVQGREANQSKACSRKMGRVKNASFRPWVLDGDAGSIMDGAAGALGP